MRVLLTGGSGDAGTLLSQRLLARGDSVRVIDLAPPRLPGIDFIKGSIVDRDVVAQAMQDIECVVHIAAWHGVHEGHKTPAEFHDLNVTGTFNVLQASVDADVKKVVFVSSTSVSDRYGLYGSTKVLGEEMVAAYAARNTDKVYMTLRPRAFIPSWNRSVYSNILEWAAWFMKGAVHIDDFADALDIAVRHVPQDRAPVYVIDGAYDYTPQELAAWDGTAFDRHYAQYRALAQQHGIDTSIKPKVLDIAPHNRLPGYVPCYSLRNFLEEFDRYGLAGAPAPF